jgi:hypothetical protein
MSEEMKLPEWLVDSESVAEGWGAIEEKMLRSSWLPAELVTKMEHVYYIGAAVVFVQLMIAVSKDEEADAAREKCPTCNPADCGRGAALSRHVHAGDGTIFQRHSGKSATASWKADEASPTRRLFCWGTGVHDSRYP